MGASGAAVTGWTATVSQKSTEGTQRYRVGIVSSGTKVAYTFLNPLEDGYDLTDGEWDTVAVRARGNQNLGVMSLDDFSQKIAQDIASKA